MKLSKIKTLVLASAIFLTACGSDTSSYKQLSQNDAKTEVETYYKDINPSIGKPKKDIAQTTLNEADELPDINTAYPFTVDGDGKIDVEIFVSPEKAGSGKDGILNEIAEEFNQKNETLNGQTISVSIRSIPSGTAMDYIATKKHMPDGYTPSNAQWNYMLNAKGFRTTLISDRLFGNTSGLLMKKDIYDEMKKNGEIDITNLNNTVKSGKLLGYTNPYSSSTGLSLLSELLFTFDPENPISDKAKAEFGNFQSNIPSTFITTAQLRDAAKNGSADILSISYNTYINTPEFNGYEYVPFGIRQDSPLYATTNNNEKQEVLKRFTEFVKAENNQKKAESYGFNKFDEYTFQEKTTDGNLLLSMQNLWKKNKNTKPIVGVFVTDTSGSMEGEPMNMLKRSLLNSLQYVNESNQIGLVSFSDTVTIEVPIAPMDNSQKAYFTSAIKDFTPSGGTATYNGTLVAIKMILDKMKENPDARPVIFVLSDGQQNEGHSFERLAPIVQSLGITVNTIGYNADLDELSKLAKINESVSIDASNEDVVYKIKELFNAEF